MLFLRVLYFPEKPKEQFGAIGGESFPGRIFGNAKMMKHTNMKPIGCLILATALLIGAGGGDECIHRSSTDGMRFEIDGVEYSVEWTRGGAERQGQFELSFLTVTHVDYPMTTYYGQDRGKIIVPMHPDSEKVVAKTETVYFVQDKRIIFEKGYQELGIDASRLSTNLTEMRDYLYPILEKMIRESVPPPEPEIEEE